MSEWLLVLMTSASMSLPGFHYSMVGYEPWPMENEAACRSSRALMNRFAPHVAVTCVSRADWEQTKLPNKHILYAPPLVMKWEENDLIEWRARGNSR